MNYRRFNAETDAEACARIWKEIGWISEGDEEGVQRFWSAGSAYVAELDGTPECMVHTAPGTMRYIDADLRFHCICGVTTSRVARKQRLASRLTANAVAEGAADGAFLAGLGMFEQGYYDRLGFGSGPYSVWVKFDPATLQIDVDPKPPTRLSLDDYEAIHASRLNQPRSHGWVVLKSAEHTWGRMGSSDNAFGLGYFDDDGNLTHHIWVEPKSIGSGPYRIRWMTYQSGEQFLELMALINSFGDQVRLVEMAEPRDIQIQDLIRRPVAETRVREGGNLEMGIRAAAWWQMRILDLPQCMQHTTLKCGVPVEFNLTLTDPIADHLDEDSVWQGAAGDYVVKMGPD
ncbi:MAG: GNAT family N-acetyltransferase, partial [Armatimonadota bacterium]